MEFKVTYPGATHYEIYLYGNITDDYNVSTGRILCDIATVVDTAKKMMERHNFVDADIVDTSTGEVIASVEAIQDDPDAEKMERCSGCAYLTSCDGVPTCDIDGQSIRTIDHCEAMEDDDNEPDEDFDCEIGYNPYLGCFDFDC